MTVLAKQRLKWFVPTFWVVAFLLDGIISYTFQGFLFQYPVMISTQLFLMAIVRTVYRFPAARWLLWVALIIGLFYDSFYSGIIGYYTFLMPAVVIFVRWITNYLPDSPLFQGTVYLLVLFGVEFCLFLLNSFFGNTGDFSIFITYDLGPTIAVNTLLFAALYYPLTLLLNKVSD
ncbi:MAG: rod shape-determining protein MreD [Lactobacillus sp.]|jgi:rod shape-determining protein MreD|nr:rod shape-determining protein MreD [Lactobacillus sp.]